MDDRFVKYTKLYFLVLLLFVCVPVCVGLVVAMFYGFSKIVFSQPVDFIFELFIIGLPAAFFATVYSIFFLRTKRHPSKMVKFVSYVFFGVGIVSCFIYLGWDLRVFFNTRSQDIESYHSYTLLFMAGNIGLLFLIAIVQAFATEKEKSWLDRD